MQPHQPPLASERQPGHRSASGDLFRSQRVSRRFLGLLLFGAVCAGATVFPHAEDSARTRSYVWMRSAEFNTAWDVLDGYSLGAGVNLSRHWGVELAAEFFEKDLQDDLLGKVGEEASWSFVPRVRYRVPMLKDRLVAYLVAGAGGSMFQFNDRKPHGFGHAIDADGTSFTAAFGGGIEYFLADNITFGIEGEYLWMTPFDITVDGRTQEMDMSAPLVTFGFRVFLSENHPRVLAEAAADVPARFFVGMHFGVADMADGRWASGIGLDPEVSKWGSLNQIYGLSLGVNLGRHWGVELTGDSQEWNIQVAGRGPIGEYAFVPIVPQVRFRYPLDGGRWVPFVMGGVGGAWSEFNDRKPAGNNVLVDARGLYPAASAGAGVEYFFARNASLSTEFHYNYTWDHEIRLNNGPTQKGDFSNWQVQVALRLYLIEF